MGHAFEKNEVAKNVADVAKPLTVSVGAVTQGAGTWNSSFATSDGTDDSQNVTITTTDSDDDVLTTTFALVVNNVAPSVAADNASVTVNESETAINTGAFSDPGADMIAITTSVGTVSHVAGTWDWCFGTTEMPFRWLDGHDHGDGQRRSGNNHVLRIDHEQLCPGSDSHREHHQRGRHGHG